MCGVVPIPADAKLSFPGFAFAYAISSPTLFTGSPGFAASTSGEEPTMETARRSLITSYGTASCRTGLMTIAGSIRTSVYPSGADFAVASTPMMPPAPGRLSATTGWPSCSDKRWPSVRPMKSTTPPGA